MKQLSQFPLHLKGLRPQGGQPMVVLAADITETITYVRICKIDGQNSEILKDFELPTGEHADFDAFLDAVKSQKDAFEIHRAAFSIPGPVIDGESHPLRLNWGVSEKKICEKLDCERAYLLNDLEAATYALTNADEQTLVKIYEPENHRMGNMAVLAPGNGLGEAGLFFDGDFLRPFATEGGHSEFSPRTAVEVEFYQFLHDIYGIVSWEKVLSKTGLFNIYRFLRDVKRHREPENFQAKIADINNAAQAICTEAMENNSQICKITIDTFIEFLAREANSLVLKLKATGGLILAGELPHLLENYIHRESFYQKFVSSDKMERVLKDTPIYLWKDKKLSVKGAAMYAAFHEA